MTFIFDIFMGSGLFFGWIALRISLDPKELLEDNEIFSCQCRSVKSKRHVNRSVRRGRSERCFCGHFFSLYQKRLSGCFIHQDSFHLIFLTDAQAGELHRIDDGESLSRISDAISGFGVLCGRLDLRRRVFRLCRVLWDIRFYRVIFNGGDMETVQGMDLDLQRFGTMILPRERRGSYKDNLCCPIFPI